MHELTVTATKQGKHRWTGPLGSHVNTVSFSAADYTVGTVLRVEIVEPVTPEEAVAAYAGETVAEQSPPREKPVRGERSNPPSETLNNVHGEKGGGVCENT